MGAAGRDFHNFNVYFRNNKQYQVVAFTATQIPDISGRKYPYELSGDLYPDGIPIYPENDLTRLIKEYDICKLTINTKFGYIDEYAYADEMVLRLSFNQDEAFQHFKRKTGWSEKNTHKED